MREHAQAMFQEHTGIISHAVLVEQGGDPQAPRIVEKATNLERSFLRQHPLIRNLSLGTVALFEASMATLGIQTFRSLDRPEEKPAEVAEICMTPECTISRVIGQIQAGERRPLIVVKPEQVIVPKPLPPPPVETTTSSVPVQSPVSEVLFRAQGLEIAQESLSKYIRLIPDLDGLVAQGKLPAAEAERQKAHIEKLREETTLSIAEYKKFEQSQVDAQTHQNIFSPHPYFNHNITPKRIILHWSGEDYANVPEMAHKMLNATKDGKPDRRNVQFIIDSKVLFRTCPVGRIFKGAHAPGANDDSIGIEYNHVKSMLDVMPDDAKMMVMSVVHLARTHNLPVNEETLLTHYETDLLNSPDYDRETGRIGGTLRKTDYPQNYKMRVVLPLAIALDAALGPR